MKIKNTRGRLLYFIENQLNISVLEFEKKINAPRGSINRFVNSDTNMGYDKIEKISNCYPELNMDWLISGEGEMLENRSNIVSEPEATYHKSSDNVVVDLLHSIKEALSINKKLAETNEIMALNERKLIESNHSLVNLLHSVPKKEAEPAMT